MWEICFPRFCCEHKATPENVLSFVQKSLSFSTLPNTVFGFFFNNLKFLFVYYKVNMSLMLKVWT